VRLYVGNLPFSTDADDLKELFSAHGEVVHTSIVQDRDSGRSRGFGFVEMADPEAGKAAMQAFDGFDHRGRVLKVNEARPRGQRPGPGDGPPRVDRRGGGGGGYRGGDGGGGGYRGGGGGGGYRGGGGGGGGYRGGGGGGGFGGGGGYRGGGGGGGFGGGPPPWEEESGKAEGRGQNKHARREHEKERRRRREDEDDSDY